MKPPSWTTRTVGRRWAWHVITAFGQHTWSDDIRPCMPSSRLGNTHSPTTSGMAFHHHLWAVQPVEQCQTWHDMIALGLHAQSNNVRHGMTSPPLDSTHGRTTSGVACHHRIWAAHTAKRRRVWNAIITFGQHKRSNDVGRGMKSPPLECTDGRTISGVA